MTQYVSGCPVYNNTTRRERCKYYAQGKKWKPAVCQKANTEARCIRLCPITQQILEALK